MPTPSRRRPWTVGVLGTAILLLVAAWAGGLLELVRDGERLADEVRSLGWLGPAALAGLMTALVPLGVPGVPFVLAAGLLWPAPVAIATGVAGGVASSVVGLVASRRLARHVLAERVPRWLRGLDARLTRLGLVGVVGLRLVLYLAAPADWVIGLSRVPMRTAVLGTIVGLVPATTAYVVVGPEFLGWLVTPAGLTAGVAALVLAVAVARGRRARASRSDGTRPAAPREASSPPTARLGWADGQPDHPRPPSVQPGAS